MQNDLTTFSKTYSRKFGSLNIESFILASVVPTSSTIKSVKLEMLDTQKQFDEIGRRGEQDAHTHFDDLCYLCCKRQEVRTLLA